MTHMSIRRASPSPTAALQKLALLGALWAAALPAAQAVDLGSLFGRRDSDVVEAANGRQWELRDFGRVELIGIEGKSAPNAHPANLDAARLRSLLASVRRADGDREALWEPVELDLLAPVLARALALARPSEDVAFVTAVARGAAWRTPTAVTGRAFVADGALNLIVGATGQRVTDHIRGTGRDPVLDYGSRARPSRVALSSSQAASPRADWLSLRTVGLAAPAAAVPPAAAPAPLAPAAATAVVPSPAAAPAAAAAARPSPAATPRLSDDELEARLTTLKRLHGKGLITDEEYKLKREALLSGL